jgi:hypothetical protein
MLPHDCNSNQAIGGRIDSLSPVEGRFFCHLETQAKVYLSRSLASHLAIGDEITFPIPSGDSLGTEAFIKKSGRAGKTNCLYLAPIESTSQPKIDKRGQHFVSARVRDGKLGISSVILPCATLGEHFYAISENSSVTLYDVLRIGKNCSPAEIRVAFKLRALELKELGAPRAEESRLERAFNILGHPELRTHYDSLLSNPDLPATFPYGGFGSLLVSGDRFRDGDLFFASRVLAFVPEQARRQFHVLLRSCEFYNDSAFCRDSRRKIQFWLDPVLLHIAWDPSWNRWKHLLSGKIEVEGAFVRTARYKKLSGGWEFENWETGLPGRLSVKVPADFQEDVARARAMYCRFGQYSGALDQIRLCLEHKAIERKDLERTSSELGIPYDFDIAQISWRPGYEPFFYRELSRRARRIYLFRDEYIFDLENAVVVETPQSGHATYVFTKPRDMDNFLARYTKTTKTNIRRNHENIAERLGLVGRVVHGTNPALWLKEIREYFGKNE